MSVEGVAVVAAEAVAVICRTREAGALLSLYQAVGDLRAGQPERVSAADADSEQAVARRNHLPVAGRLHRAVPEEQRLVSCIAVVHADAGGHAVRAP